MTEGLYLKENGKLHLIAKADMELGWIGSLDTLAQLLYDTGSQKTMKLKSIGEALDVRPYKFITSGSNDTYFFQEHFTCKEVLPTDEISNIVDTLVLRDNKNQHIVYGDMLNKKDQTKPKEKVLIYSKG